MAVFKAAVLIFLAMVPVISPFPVAQTAENKGKGRSYPLIISHYSNVRNSKYDNPPTTTEALIVAVESVDPKLVKDDDVEQKAPSLHTDEAEKSDAAVSDAKQEDAAAEEPKKSEEIKLVAEEKEVEGKEKKAEQDEEEKTDNNNSEKAEAVPNKDSDSADSASKNESVLAAAVEDNEDSLVSKTVVAPSNEEKIQEPLTTTKVEVDSTPITESKTASDVSTATTLTNTKEEASLTSLVVEESKPAEASVTVDIPAALEEKITPEMESTASKTPASSDDGVAKPEETKEVVTKVQDTPAVPVADDKFISEEKTATKIAEEEIVVKAPESADAESSRSTDLKPATNSEFFEEDRSFKDRPEEAILAVIRQGALDEQREKLANKNLDALHADADDIANEGIRLERDDKKTEKKEKEKEKYLSKPLLKEKKPSKVIVSDDPTQEYDDQIRGGRSKDESAKAAEEEPVVISLVPDNYPVVLPSGESTLSDKIKTEDAEKPAEEAPIVVGAVPDNYPVVLPSGETTLSDKLKPEDIPKAAEEVPIVVGAVPDNYPVVLPSGESTLSDQIKPEQRAAEEGPIVVGAVPDNVPVVLPSGESTLSDKIKPEDTKESPKEDKTAGEQ